MSVLKDMQTKLPVAILGERGGVLILTDGGAKGFFFEALTTRGIWSARDGDNNDFVGSPKSRRDWKGVLR